VYSVAITKHAVLGSWCIRLLSVVVMFAVIKLLCLEADDEKLGMVSAIIGFVVLLAITPPTPLFTKRIYLGVCGC
jgi:hypothetical protein